MNKKTQRLFLDMLLALLVGIAGRFLAMVHPYLIGIFLLPYIWLALRHGASAAILAVAVGQGLCIFLMPGEINFPVQIASEVFPSLFVGIAGFFARNTQRTLNNRRLSSTYLNIVTASILVSLAWFLWVNMVNPLWLQEASFLSLTSSDFWLSWGITTLASSLILCLLARFYPKALIPKRSKYLSRRETTSLLND